MCLGGCAVFVCAKIYIHCGGLWADEDFEVIVKGRDTKFTWEFIGIYRAPNDGIQFIEKLLARTGCTGNSTKCSIKGVI